MYHFRVWEKRKWKCMLYGKITDNFPFEYKFEDNINRIWLEEWGPPEWTIMLYTDYFDKNNNKICELDIVKVDNKIFIVQFGTGSFYLELPGHSGTYGYLYEYLEYNKIKDFEIIGNVFENTKLLNKLRKEK